MSDFRQEEPNKKKLFVGNLPFSITQGELEETFSQFGELASVNVITDRMSGRSKGFAFVEFTTEEAAQAAVDGMAGKQIGERDAIVNLARPRTNDGGNRGGGGRSGGFGGGGRSFDRNDRRGGNRY